MADQDKTITIVLIKNYWSGYLHSLAWIAALTAGIALAVWLQSTAMQWVMAVFWFMTLIGWAMGEKARKSRTPEDAITEIQALIAERKST